MKLSVAFSLTLLSLATSPAASVEGSLPLYRHHRTSLEALQADDAAVENNPATEESFIDAPGDAVRQLHESHESPCHAEGTIYCGGQCMKYTEYYDRGYFGEEGVPAFQDLSVESCADAGLELKCVNPRGQLYVGGFGDYYPACVNASAAPDASAVPDLEGYPTDDDMCTEEAWEAFSSSDGYNFSYGIGAYDKATFMWNVVGSDVEGKLTFRGLFGFLAMGFANEGGGHNGMQGASVILGLPGGEYSPVTGLNMSQEPTVMEYVIHPVYSRFRHWGHPVGGMNNSNYEAEFNDCFTAISYRTDSINGIPFNLTGTDDMVWAANGRNAFVEYHGGDQRNRFVVEWATGKAWDPNAMGMEDDGDDGHGHGHGDDTETNHMEDDEDDGHHDTETSTMEDDGHGHGHDDDTETNTVRANSNSGADSTNVMSSLLVLSLAVVGAWTI